MDTLSVDRGGHDAVSIHTIDSVSETAPRPETPARSGREGLDGSAHGPVAEDPVPVTPIRPRRPVSSRTPRLKKKVSWKGKTIVILIPWDEGRGKPGLAPMPLGQEKVNTMLRAWEQLGYDIGGFDLEGPRESQDPLENYSQSRNEWPNDTDLVNERSQKRYKVTLPDLNAWKDYVNELQEAKLRALGVSFGDDEPVPPPSISPAPSNLSRQASNQISSLPFSPPLPTPSGAGTGAQGFPFPAAFHPGHRSSATQSPAVPSVASPVSFNGLPGPGKFNPRASISISPHELPFHVSGQPSPHGWSPQVMLQQQLGRTGSPSTMNMNSFMSPPSPLQRDGMSPPVGIHQRHQSLQYPTLPHQHLQRQNSARASPRLQELREVDEETQSNPYEKSESRTTEPGHSVRHNASDSLQKEIDDAEYHLEEQFRSQLEHEDYNPNNESDNVNVEKVLHEAKDDGPSHARGPSVHFGNFGTDSEDGPKLHHPQPHSRGHSLSQKAFFEADDVPNSMEEGSFEKQRPEDDESRKEEAYEVETNPSNLGTPVQTFDLVDKVHQRSFSTVSNPWADEPAEGSRTSSRRVSHASKPSLSRLNAGAAEFKFNPSSNFTPGQFVFGSSANVTPSGFKPSMFQASSFVPKAPQSATSSHFSMPSNASAARINVLAPAFSPQNSDFSFSASGPKFNPGAQSFQPLGSFTPSITSTGASGNEASDNRASSIFGNIDLSLSDTVKAAKKSKAIPIVRPSSRHSPAPADSSAQAASVSVDKDGQLTDNARNKKKLRDNKDDGDDVPLFAEPTPEPEIVPQAHINSPSISEGNLEAEITTPGDRHEDEETADLADTSLASTVLSESTDGKLPSESNDTKATTSPSATSLNQDQANWRPFEFRSETDIHDFNMARPFGDDEPSFPMDHSKSLSAAAKPFTPTGFTFGVQDSVEMSFDSVLETQPGQLVDPAEVSDDDRAGSPTPGPESRPAAQQRPSYESQSESAPPAQKGLMSSRFASPPPALRGLRASRFAPTPSPPPKSAGLAASRYAASPSPVSEVEATMILGNEQDGVPSENAELHSFEPLPVSPPSEATGHDGQDALHEPTFEEIDAVMQHLNQNDPTMGVKKSVESPQWHHPSPVRNISVAAITKSPQLLTQEPVQRDAPSPSPRHYHSLPQEIAPLRPSTELEDPFVDPPLSALSQTFDAHVHNLNAGESLPESDWADAFSTSEQDKLEQRVQYFDGRVNDVIGSILASRLGPLEKTLVNVQDALGHLARRTPSSRRDRRSVSAEIQESDADDEDDELPVRRSMSPRKDKRMDQIRIAVMDALTQQQTSLALQAAQLEPDEKLYKGSEVLNALADIKEQFSQNLRLDFRGEDLRNIVEVAVERRMPPTPQPVIKDDEEANIRLAELQSKGVELEQRLRTEQSRADSERSRVRELEEKIRVEESKVENETAIRRAAEDRAAEIRRQLEQAETKIEVEIMNRSVFDQRIHDLEERLRQQENRTELEQSGRRDAEDRLSEIQRLLRISSEEEDRLRSVLEERDQKIKSVEQSSGKNSMRLALLEAGQSNAEQTQAELKNRLHVTETELRDTRQEARHWQSEAEHARESTQRRADDFAEMMNLNKHLQRLIDTLGVQLTENERIRDNWRAKFVSLQDDIANAASEITEENARRSKKEETLVARQEVLDARLQAEARTRERLEVEVERLEDGERAGMRAVSECKRLEGLLADLRNENHNLQQNILRSQREIQEAKDAAAAEVRRAQTAVEAELEATRSQALTVRTELEEEVVRARSQLDQVKLDADTAKAHHEMMLEEAQGSRQTEVEEAEAAMQKELEEMARKHQNEIEDVQARYERQIGNAIEDAQRTEQNLLERLSLSTSKTEHLQDRVTHLEDKVQIAQEAARAAAQAAAQASKSFNVTEPTITPGPVAQTKQLAQAMQLPEKISPQALRESIMVLQEQLQAREQRIEELEQSVAKLDPDSATKISKRDDEIIWLRELLAVRHGDLQDIIAALSADNLDKESIKEAVIRLKANLQMEEQERERAMNGGSAINLPNLAASLRDVATPRVAQAVGPLAAAWGSWRKSNNISLLSSPAAGRMATPSKASPATSQSSFRAGLMTPPASSIRNTPQAQQAQIQPTAFGNIGRRFTPDEFASRSRGPSTTARQAEKMPLASTPPPRQNRRNPMTPPIARSGSYDADARRVEDFDDASFFED